MLLSTAYFPPVQYLALIARDMTLSPDRVCPSTVWLEASERYQKQSYRNRCYILGGATASPSLASQPNGGATASPTPASQPNGGATTPPSLASQTSGVAMAPQAPASQPPSGGSFGGTEMHQRPGIEMLQVPVVHEDDMSIRKVRVDWSTPWLQRTERALDTAYYSSAFYEYYRDELFALLEQRPERLWDLNLLTLRFLLDKSGIACTLKETTDFALPDTLPDDYRFRIHPKHPDNILQDLGLDRPYFQVFRDRFGFTPGLSSLDLLFNAGPDSILSLKRL